MTAAVWTKIPLATVVPSNDDKNGRPHQINLYFRTCITCVTIHELSLITFYEHCDL